MGQDTKKYPFKFLDYYNREDIDLFFGREEEIEILFKKVQESKIVLVYGESGAGKTSLIKCGLANKFEIYDWFPIEVRRKDGINESLINEIDTKLSLRQEEINFYFRGKYNEISDIPLSEKAALLYNIKHTPLYFIFDQFEELFIGKTPKEIAKTPKEEENFYKNIASLLNTNIPIKIIFSMREEYIGHLYKMETNIPSFVCNRFRVESVGIEQVRDIIRETTQSDNSIIKISAEIDTESNSKVIDEIFSIINDNQGINGRIELPYLQVFLNRIYQDLKKEKRKEDEVITITLASLSRYENIGDVLKDFLDEKRDEIKKEFSNSKNKIEIIDKVLLELITQEGTKKSIKQTEFIKLFLKEDQESVLKVLNFFTKCGIIHTGTTRYEIKHDSLAKRIADFRSTEEKHLLYLVNFISTNMVLEGAARNLNEAQFASVDYSLDKLKETGKLNEEQQKYIEENRNRINKEKQEKEEQRNKAVVEALKQVKREEELREKAEKSFSLLKWLIRALIITLFFISYQYRQIYTQNIELGNYKKSLDEKDRLLDEKDKKIDMRNATLVSRELQLTLIGKTIREKQDSVKKLSENIGNLKKQSNEKGKKLNEKHLAEFVKKLNDAKALKEEKQNIQNLLNQLDSLANLLPEKNKLKERITQELKN